MMYHNWNRKAWLAGVLLLLAILVLFLQKLPSCSGPAHDVTVTADPTNPPPPPPTTSPSPPPTPPSPPSPPSPPAPPAPPTPPPVQKPCDQVTTFSQLQPLIALNCAGCHVGFDSYDKAATAKAQDGAALIDDMIRRINLDPSSADHMPAQRPKLADKDLTVFAQWKADGLLKAGDCVGSTPPPAAFQDFAATEKVMDDDASGRGISDQPNTRYLIAVDQVNLGHPDLVAAAKLAGAKALNMVNAETPTITNLTVVAPGIWRIDDITRIGIQANEWKAIEDASLLQFESFTQRGLDLKRITQSRLPWMYVQDFNDTVLRNATVYYKLTQVPDTLAQLEAQLGVNLNDFVTRKALLLAFNGSTLALAANRLIGRVDSTNGAFWFTEDTGPIVSAAQNVFTNPLVAAAGGQAILKFAAGEQLYSLPNGLLASFLADATGKRLDQADPAVVHDFTTNPNSPIIKNAVSCSRCHNGGIIPAVDQVRGRLGASGLSAVDAGIADDLYKPQTILNERFAADNQRIQAALTQLGVDPTAPDPISKVSDVFLGDQTAAQLGALLFLRPDDFTRCINTSPQGQAQLGQVLTGGTVSHDQFVQVSKQLQADCRIFQDKEIQ